MLWIDCTRLARRARRSLADSPTSCPSSVCQPHTHQPDNRVAHAESSQMCSPRSSSAIDDIAALILSSFISVKTQRGFTLSGQDPPQDCQGGRSARIVVTVACVMFNLVVSPGIGPMTSNVRARQQIAILQPECCYHTTK